MVYLYSVSNMGKLIIRLGDKETSMSRCLEVTWPDNFHFENILVWIASQQTETGVLLIASLSSCKGEIIVPEPDKWMHEALQVFISGLQRTDSYHTYTVCSKDKWNINKAAESAKMKHLLPIDNLSKNLGVVSDIAKNNKNVFKMQIRHIKSSRNLIFKTKQKPASQLAMVAMKQQIGLTCCEKIILEKTKNCTVYLPEYIMTAPTATFQVHLLQKDIEGEGFVLYKKMMSSEVTQFSVAVIPTNPNPIKDPDLTKVQLTTLLKRSLPLLDNNMKVLSHVYRNKQNTYFRALEDDHCGIMETVLKNHNGDQGSCINGQIQGLFLSTTLTQNGKIPKASYFGSHSVRIKASKLLNEKTNLYFADLYCHYVNHHVTVVAARPGSQADQFCQLKLVPLDARSNRFLQILDNEVKVVGGVIVELFYTEEVDLKTMSIETPNSIYYAEVHALGRGKTRKNGIPKNKKCRICVL